MQNMGISIKDRVSMKVLRCYKMEKVVCNTATSRSVRGSNVRSEHHHLYPWGYERNGVGASVEIMQDRPIALTQTLTNAYLCPTPACTGLAGGCTRSCADQVSICKHIGDTRRI